MKKIIIIAIIVLLAIGYMNFRNSFEQGSDPSNPVIVSPPALNPSANLCKRWDDQLRFNNEMLSNAENSNDPLRTNRIAEWQQIIRDTEAGKARAGC